MDEKIELRSLLEKIATGPELSKDVSLDEAYSGMRLVLKDEANPVQAGLFLIALRMKRETNEELLGLQKALLEAAQHVEVAVDELVEIADPFNGYTRGLPISPFVAPLLAACGVPTVCHGVKAVGPKYGITHYNVFSAMGCDVELSMLEVAERLADPEIGWAYIDQSVSCPSLHRLIELRDLMVKRTCLTTLEVALRPFSARRNTHLVTGYVHKPYPPIYTMLARQAGYQSAMIVRGVEGGVISSLQQPSKVVAYRQDGADEEKRIEPEIVGICDAEHRAVPIPEKAFQEKGGAIDTVVAATEAAKAGLAALKGERGLAYDSLVYCAALLLNHVKQKPIQQCAQTVRNALDSGSAHKRLKP